MFKSVDDLYPTDPSASVLDRAVDDADRQWFRQQMSSVKRFTGYAWLLSPEPDQQTLPVPSVTDLMMEPG